MTNKKAEDHPIANLSFVKSKPKGRCFWHVRSNGNHHKDTWLGYRFALEYLALEEADAGGGHLQLIVRDMPRKLGPIEIGFFVLVSFAAGAGAHKARRVEAYWKTCAARDRVAAA